MEKGCMEDAGKNPGKWHYVASVAHCAEKCFGTWQGG